MELIWFTKDVHRGYLQKLSCLLAVQEQVIRNLPKKSNYLFLPKFFLIFNFHFYNVLKRVSVNARRIIEDAEVEKPFLIFTSGDETNFGEVADKVAMDSFGSSGHLITDEILVDVVELLHDIDFLEPIVIEMEGAWIPSDEVSASAKEPFVSQHFMDILLINDKLNRICHYEEIVAKITLFISACFFKIVTAL